ncbi:MAG: hypothetical protein U1E26_03805 [Coriobacteriia bacterium]|nr:hypothetical protein [Coriobacteriia bacterium]
MPDDDPLTPEHHRVPGADILREDTWGEKPDQCPGCGQPISGGQAQCRTCGQWLETCARSCSSCASPRCVGGLRSER